MTGGANRLTVRANRAGGSASDAPPPPAAQPAIQLRVFAEALDRLGYDSSALLVHAGIRRADLEDPDGLVPCSATIPLLEGAMRVRPMKNLAAQLAAVTPIGAYALLDYLIVTSECVGEGLARLARYLHLVGAPTVVELRPDEDPIRVMMRAPGIPFAVEFTASLSVFHLRRETESQLRIEYVSFAHQPDDVSALEQLLGCPVRAGASWSGLALPREAWGLPLRRRDAVLRGLLERQAHEVVCRMPAGDPRLRELRRLLAARAAGGDLRMSPVARELAMSPRTLQRRLTAAGATYTALVDDARRDAAERLLVDRSLSIGEVAYLLGFSEPSAFHRAFKRWRRMTPLEFRRARPPTGERT